MLKTKVIFHYEMHEVSATDHSGQYPKKINGIKINSQWNERFYTKKNENKTKYIYYKTHNDYFPKKKNKNCSGKENSRSSRREKLICLHIVLGFLADAMPHRRAYCIDGYVYVRFVHLFVCYFCLVGSMFTLSMCECLSPLAMQQQQLFKNGYCLSFASKIQKPKLNTFATCMRECDVDL